jgi:FkbM family methyltransferase
MHNKMRYPGSLMILPITRREVPGWGKVANLFSVCGAQHDVLWIGSPRKTIRGKWHRYQMELNLTDWSERQTFFLGRYLDLETQLLMNAVLRPGDRFVDVGGNIGMITLHAAALVGAGGQVDTFEPNPACCLRIESALRGNDIRHVRLHRVGLSDQVATATLTLLTNYSGMGTLAPVDDGQKEMITGTVSVPVEVGDSILLRDSRPAAMIKIDVEGFETRALRGMREALSAWRPIVTTEILAEWLRRAGSSVEELFDLMHGLKYRPLELASHGIRRQLRLRPIGDPQRPPANVAWVPDDGAWRDRLREWL